MSRARAASVVASGQWRDPDGIRRPAGEVHAWVRGTDQSLCGLSLFRSRLIRFPHVDWPDIDPATGREADEVRRVCPRCDAAVNGRRDGRRWTRTQPRP